MGDDELQRDRAIGVPLDLPSDGGHPVRLHRNVCQSPVAERLAARWARDLLGHSPQNAVVDIRSVGVAAPIGRPMDARSAAALTALDGDPGGFASRLLERSMAEPADLVLTMSRRQRREVLEKNPRGLRRTFTLLEVADLLGSADLTRLRLIPLPEGARELGCASMRPAAAEPRQSLTTCRIPSAGRQPSTRT